MDKWKEVENKPEKKIIKNEKGERSQADECLESPAGCWYFKTKRLTRLAGIHRLCYVPLI